MVGKERQYEKVNPGIQHVIEWLFYHFRFKIILADFFSVADASSSRPEELQTSETTFRPASNTTVWNANIQLKVGTSNQASARVICENCHTDSSPEWRKGPTGQKT